MKFNADLSPFADFNSIITKARKLVVKHGDDVLGPEFDISIDDHHTVTIAFDRPVKKVAKSRTYDPMDDTFPGKAN